MPEFAPPRGTLPVLQYCPPQQLSIDGHYQRDIDNHSRTLIGKISREWDWSLCQPLVVSRRDDGALFVIDGQHRLAAALQRGDIGQLPCVIIPSIDPGDEARAFVALNQQRRPLTPFALWRAAIAAGDEMAGALARIAVDAGICFVGQRNLDLLKPGSLNNVGAVRNFHRRHGDAITRKALVAIGRAFDGEVLRLGSGLFAGVSSAILELGSDLDLELLIAVLGGASQDEWRVAFSATASGRLGAGYRDGTREAIVAAYLEASNEAEAA